MKSKSILVNQFPGNVSGCYIIRDNDTVLYVGQSKRLRSRWIEHHHRDFIETNFPNATVQIIFCHQSDLLKLESKLISELKPVINNKYGEELLKATGVKDGWYETEDWFKYLENLKPRRSRETATKGE